MAFDDVDEERLGSIARTCFEMVTPLRIDLALRKTDQTRLKIIQSKQKEAKEKIKELGMKTHYAMDLYNQHLDIEFKKQAKGLSFNIPLIPDDTSIFRVEILKFPGAEDGYNEMDHVECALINAQKVYAESIVWTIFYSELENMEREVKEEMNLDKKKELTQTTIREIAVKQELMGEEKSQYSLDCQRIFKGMKGQKIFEYLQDNLVSKKNRLANYTFIFRRMQRDGYIHDDVREKKFRDFISFHFEIEIALKLKPYGYNATDSKEKLYSDAIRSVKEVSR